MPPTAIEIKRFEPGTTGWTAGDLDEPRIEREWVRGSYEIVEGVLTTMPPAYYVGGEASSNLVFILRDYLRERKLPTSFPAEADIVIDAARVAKADFVYLTKQDKARHAAAARVAGRPDPRRTRFLVPPTLVIESISPGHEQHDRRTKRAWYEEFGVPNYWLLDAYERTLQCLKLVRRKYRVDASGQGDDEVRPSCFPGLSIPLSQVWDD